MRTLQVCSLVLFLTAVSAVPQQVQPVAEPPELTSMRAQFDKRVKQATTPVLQEYIRGLQGLLTRATQAGRLDDAIVIREEIRKQTAALQGTAQDVKAAQPLVDVPPVQKSANTAARARKNAVPDGDFEKGSMEGWWMSGTDKTSTKVVKDPQNAQSGHYYMRVKKDDRAEEMWVGYDMGFFKWGDHLYATAWVRIDDYRGGDVLLALDAKSKDNKNHYLGLGPGWSQVIKASCGWTKLTIDCVLPSKEEAPLMSVVSIALEIHGGDTGDVLLDNVYVGTEPDPADSAPR